MTTRESPIPARRSIVFLMTCEHGGNEVPEGLLPFFSSPQAAQHLHSHRGHDPGSLIMARTLAGLLRAPLEFSTVSRLVIDLNRSPGSPQLFSKFLTDQDWRLREQILATHYAPYRQRIENSITRQVDAGQAVLHLSIHTFTPRFRGSQRRFDIGVLFDEDRPLENRISHGMVHRLDRRFRVRANEPYKGTDDGLTTWLRTQFDDPKYAGIELELNNRVNRLSQKTQSMWCREIAKALLDVCDALGCAVIEAGSEHEHEG